MKRESLLTVAVVALLLLNFGTLGFLLFRRPPHPPGQGLRPLDRQIVEKLALNADQKQKFEQLKTAHHEQMMSCDKDYRAALGNYFDLLKSDVVLATQQDSMQAILSQIQQTKVKVTFQHFKDLKALCTPEQRNNFNALIPDLLEVILPPRPMGPPGRQ